MKLINASVTNLKGLNLVSWNLPERYVIVPIGVLATDSVPFLMQLMFLNQFNYELIEFGLQMIGKSK